jgi:hypothetical protein
MGRGKGVGKNRCPRRPGETETVASPNGIIPALLWFFLVTCLFTQQGIAAPDLVLTDLWDGPHRLDDICDGRMTILFVCDTELSVCREGAIFFDTRADEIEAEGLRAALVLTGQPAEARAFALRTRIDLPVFVDSGRQVFDKLLHQEVLPALVLMDGEGQHVKTLYGGGESLEGNIIILIEEGVSKGRRWWLILIPIALAALLPFVLS